MVGNFFFIVGKFIDQTCNAVQRLRARFSGNLLTPPGGARSLLRPTRLEHSAMGVGRIFSRGEPIVDFFRGAKDFSWGSNNGEISFYQLETKRKTFFHQTVNGKISSFKFLWARAKPPCPRIRHLVGARIT